MSAARERLARRLALAYPDLDPLSQRVPRAPDATEFVDMVDAVLDEVTDRLTVDLEGVSDLEREAIAFMRNTVWASEQSQAAVNTVLALVARVTS